MFFSSCVCSLQKDKLTWSKGISVSSSSSFLYAPRAHDCIKPTMGVFSPITSKKPAGAWSLIRVSTSIRVSLSATTFSPSSMSIKSCAVFAGALSNLRAVSNVRTWSKSEGPIGTGTAVAVGDLMPLDCTEDAEPSVAAEPDWVACVVGVAVVDEGVGVDDG